MENNLRKIIIDGEEIISTEEKTHSNLFESLYFIFGLTECSLLIKPSSINNWHPLHTPNEIVSFLSKKPVIAFFASGL